MSFTLESLIRTVPDDLFASIPEFDGIKNTLELYIERCEYVNNLLKIKDNPAQDLYLYHVCTSQLAGNAAFAISDETDLKSWTDLKLLLIRRFGDLILYQGSIPIEIDALIIDEDESYIDFCARIQAATNSLVAKLDTIDSDLRKLKIARLNRLAINQFLCNLPDDLIKIIRSNACSTLDHALDIAVEELKGRVLHNRTYHFNGISQQCQNQYNIIQPISDMLIQGSVQKVPTTQQKYPPNSQVRQLNPNVEIPKIAKQNEILMQSLQKPQPTQQEITKKGLLNANDYTNDITCSLVYPIKPDSLLKTQINAKNEVTNTDQEHKSEENCSYGTNDYQETDTDGPVSVSVHNPAIKQFKETLLLVPSVPTSELDYETDSNILQLDRKNNLDENPILAKIFQKDPKNVLAPKTEELTNQHTDKNLPDQKPSTTLKRNETLSTSQSTAGIHEIEIESKDYLTIHKRNVDEISLTNDPVGRQKETSKFGQTSSKYESRTIKKIILNIDSDFLIQTDQNDSILAFRKQHKIDIFENLLDRQPLTDACLTVYKKRKKKGSSVPSHWSHSKGIT